MQSSFTGKEIYQHDFDPRAYLETYYGAGSGVFIKDGFLKFVLKNLHKTFTKGGVKGDLLIDIGPGPAIYQELSACEVFKEIIAADFTDRNRQYLDKWLKNESGLFDWTPSVKFVCDLEGSSGKVVEKQEKLRRTLKQVVKCDVTNRNPLAPLVLPKADAVLTVGCLECACKDLDTYRQVLRNLSSLLKVGGHLIISSILGSTCFTSGSKQFSLLTLDEDFLRAAVTDSGFVIKDLELLPRDYDKEMFQICDHNASIYLVACKQKDV
ncbi:indolethylamine N-methyltransferase [Microcaecilia unicolor]|uniref:Indolethylamine N-methyltransferase-like n=1 Tax=Microcaecilia unicolor TaxID=1415580 RepID=A0A6P7ZV52_9AMPH|nr:indolethylamine N-methyltransferase-like [Microcaecilia unicolor]